MQYISIVKVEVESISPLFISDGEDVLLDEERGMAYIPATTIAGAFRSYLNFLGEDPDRLFGEAGEGSIGSSIYIRDCYGKNKGFERRDGVRIQGETGRSKQGGKLERFYLKKGINFSLNFKIESHQRDIQDKKDLLYKCLQGLDRSFIRLGGNKSNGLGVFKVKEIKEINFDFNDKNQWVNYIRRNYSDIRDITDKVLSESPNDKFVEFTLKGSLTTPILIGAPESYDPEDADSTSMKSGENYIIPGSSFKGVLRSGVEKIANHFNNLEAAKEVFGSSSQDNRLSRIFVDEAIIDTGEYDEVKYNRIKVDKFTGGVRKTGLMDDSPTQGDIEFKVIYRIENERERDAYAIGMIALALRDLGTENLSLGGGFSIGRGRFKGDSMGVSVDGDKIEVDFNNKSISHEEKLNSYIKSVASFRYEEGESDGKIYT